MHYFQFNIGDYASHTRHLSLMEDLAYRRMLDAYYLRECELPLCAIEVGRIISMRYNISDVEQVLNEFFERTETGWTHKRADAEIAHFRDKRQKASNAGKASAERRSNVRSTDVQPTNNQEPITNNQEPIEDIFVQLPLDDDLASEERVKVQDVIEYWNEVAGRIGKPKVQRMSPARMQLLKARISQNTIDDFVLVFQNIEKSQFLRDWKAMGFDWVFKASNFQKILEGNYNG